MQITKVSFLKRKNLGNYEHEEISAEAILEEGSNETLEGCIKDLRSSIERGFGHEVLEKPAVETPAPKKEKEIKPEKKAKKEAEPVATKPVEQPAKEAAEESSEENTEAEGDTAAEALEEAKKDAAKKKSLATKYSRNDDKHKKHLADWLDIEHKGWRERASKAKEVSAEMEGQPFLDREGSILKSFRADFTKKLKG